MATFGHGTTLSWNGNTVAENVTIGGISFAADSIEVTTHDSTGRHKEFIAGLVDAGTLPISGYFDPTDSDGQIAMLTDFKAGTTRECILTLPSSIAVFTFNGFATKWEVGEANQSGAVPFSADIKITGVPSIAVATSAGLTTPFFAISESAVITPDPAAATYSYVATVLTGITSVTVTPTATAGTITVNGNTVATGVASSAIALGAAGTNTTITIVVTETNKVPKTYTILVARAS